MESGSKRTQRDYTLAFKLAVVEQVAAHRARLREAGLRPLSVWALPEHHQRIKDFVAVLQKEDLRQDAKRPRVGAAG